jgi:hypothetical protein
VCVVSLFSLFTHTHTHYTLSLVLLVMMKSKGLKISRSILMLILIFSLSSNSAVDLPLPLHSARRPLAAKQRYPPSSWAHACPNAICNSKGCPEFAGKHSRLVA